MLINELCDGVFAGARFCNEAFAGLRRHPERLARRARARRRAGVLELFYGCEQGVVILSTHSLADELGMALERIIAVGQ